MKPIPILLIAMGVSGCGKSTVAQALANHFRFEFVEADDFHSDENKQWMATGNALTDTMREPWIASLQTYLAQSADSGRSCVMSFSGLRRQHRAKMRDLAFSVLYLHLQGSQELISKRMSERSDHFMPDSLLDSQFSALESPSDESDVVSIDINQSLDEVVRSAIRASCQVVKRNRKSQPDFLG